MAFSRRRAWLRFVRPLERLRDSFEKARERGVGEPARDHARSVAQARAAAHAFAAGRDGGLLLPPEMRARVEVWRQRLLSTGERLDLEGWLLGLLALACLFERESLACGPTNAVPLAPSAAVPSAGGLTPWAAR
jgi:hypothetical protein